MKKFLALVLALIMAMSLVTISAGAADFTDQASIQYNEATDVMSALKVIDGYTDGSFGPSNTLTRGAAAKIICNLVLGRDVADVLPADATKFPDVPASNVFSGYIGYCAKEGIINGYADGTFKPSGTLTGYAFLKMLLGALEYDADIEGFNGDGWSINVAKKAADLGLTDGNDGFVGTAAVTREEACLYALNTLMAEVVEYDNAQTITIGDVKISNSSKATPVKRTGKDYRGANEVAAEGGTQQFCEKHFDKLTLADDAKDDANRPARTWTYKNEEVGTYAKSNDLKVTLTGLVEKGQLYSAIGKTAVDKIKDGKVTVKWYIDGKLSTTIAGTEVINANSFIDKSTAKVDSKWMGRGSTTEVYYKEPEGDKNGELTLFTTEEYVVKASADYNSKTDKLTLKGDLMAAYAGPLSVKGEDVAAAKTVKEDDYLVVTISRIGTGKILTLAPARKVSGSVNTYRSNATVTLDSTPYPYAGLADEATKETGYEIGAAATIVVDEQNNVLYVDEVSAIGSYIYIMKTGTSSGLETDALASAFFTDGTQKDITVKKYVDNAGNEKTTTAAITAAMGANKWYSYSVDSDGKYTVKAKLDNAGKKAAQQGGTVADTAVGTKLIKKQQAQFINAAAFDGTVQAWKGNNNTVFFFYDADKTVTVYKGIAAVPELALKTDKAAENDVKVAALLKEGIAEYVFVDYSARGKNYTLDDGTSASDYIFVMWIDGDVDVDANNDKYYDAAAIVNGEFKEIKIDADSAALPIGVLCKSPKINSKGFYTSATEVSETGDTFNFPAKTNEVTFKDGVLEIGGRTYIATNAKVNFVMVPGDGNAMMADEGVDYEYELDTNASFVGSTMNMSSYESYKYNFSGILTEKDGTVIDTLYVFVYDAVEKAA